MDELTLFLGDLQFYTTVVVRFAVTGPDSSQILCASTTKYHMPQIQMIHLKHSSSRP